MLELYTKIKDVGEDFLGENPGDFPSCEEIAHRLQMVPADIQKVYRVWEIDVKVFRAAYEILAQGKYPVRNEICAAVHMSPRDIKDSFNAWKDLNPKKEVLVKVENQSIGTTQETPEETPEEIPNQNNSPRKSLTRQQQKTELEVAQELTHRHYLLRFQQFQTPGLQGDFEGAIASIDEQYYTLNPELASPKALAGFLIKNSANNMKEGQQMSDNQLSETGEPQQQEQPLH